MRDGAGRPATGVDDVARDGVRAPVRLLSPAQCALFVRHLQQDPAAPELVWPKACAATDRVFYNFATTPALIAALRPLLGDDIILWGASIVAREPGQVHPWHCDVESAQPGQRVVSVWIGLQNTGRDTALKLITRSHRFGRPVQQVMAESGVDRTAATDAMVLAWARGCDPEAALVQPAMTDGDAILFDGHLWHASANSGPAGRIALLLQYAAAETAVRIPTDYRWPFRYSATLPPVIVVHGQGDPEVNRLVPPPPPCPEGGVLTTSIRAIEIDDADRAPWRPYPMFCGATPLLDSLECHVSVLRDGHCPHPPHAHGEEELLIVLEGEADLLLNDGPTLEGARRVPVGPHAIAYYPAYSHHTLRQVGPTPTRYLMLKWRGAPAGPGGDAVAVQRAAFPDSPSAGFATRLLFEHPTVWLDTLHAHASTLQPGAGYAPHADDYDVAIILLSGTVETLGRRLEAGSVVFYAAGEPHGLTNVGATCARYLVFEFHAPPRRRAAPRLFPLPRPAVEAPTPAEVRMVWLGPPLSAYEAMSLASFVARGQRVSLFSDDTALRVPDGVTLIDARELLPSWPGGEPARGDGDVNAALQADLMRYALLERFGGWCCDPDVVLIGRQLPEEDLYLAGEGGGVVSPAVMRLPAGLPLIADAIAATRDRLSAVGGAGEPPPLTRLVAAHGLAARVRPRAAACPVHRADARKLFLPDYREELEYRVAGADFLPLWTGLWRSVRIPKEYGPPQGSFLDALFREFGIRSPPRLSAAAVARWFDEADWLRTMDRARVEALQRARDEAVFERDQLLSSTSWRLTAPLRATMDTLARALGRSG